MRQSGLAGALRGYAQRALKEGRGVLAGICGGLQMLGQDIADPLNLEEGGSEPGLGLLPLTTELGCVKCLRRTSGRALAALAGEELAVTGYEIHHGRSGPSAAEVETKAAALTPLLTDHTGQALGWGLAGAPICTAFSTRTLSAMRCSTACAGRGALRRLREPLTAWGRSWTAWPTPWRPVWI